MGSDHMAPVTSEERLDPNRKLEMPKFESVDKWLGNLSNWCEDALTQIADLERDGSTEQHERIAELEHHVNDLQQRAELFDSLAEQVFDIDRGIRTPSEVVDWLRQRGHVA